MDKICVVGLGYVGLPLAVEFAKVFETIGFDIDKEKISELKAGFDRCEEITSEELKKSTLFFTNGPKYINTSNLIIVAVPTPITRDKLPDLSLVKNASEIVGKNLAKGSTVVYESTVYPGVTEDICIPILEKFSKLRCGIDFKVGYSPERINPGDKEHTIGKIVKVVSGMDDKTTDKIAEIYGKIIKAGVFKAKNIKTAEAAKVIENIQRDLNIALMNELSLIFERMGIRTLDVLEAASTKWNFQKYYPGLVGGHCIGIDPYYLTYKAKELGYNPKVILAGRDINEYMAIHIIDKTIEALNKFNKKIENSIILILGLTFKENVNDARNSKAEIIIKGLKEKKANVIAYDPLLDNKSVKKIFGLENTDLSKIKKVDAVILVTKHNEFRKIGLDQLKNMMDKPILIDARNFYNEEEAKKKGFYYFSL